jgi:hypothetical protein
MVQNPRPTFNALGLVAENRDFPRNCHCAALRAGFKIRCMICDAEPLAVVRDYNGLVEAIRARVTQLQVSYETVTEVSGLPDRHINKLLCGLKRFGPVSLGLTLSALGMAIVLVQDDEALAKVKPRLVPKKNTGSGRRSSGPDPGKPCSCAEFRQASSAPPWPAGPDAATPADAL